MNIYNLNARDLANSDYEISMVDDRRVGFHGGAFVRLTVFGLMLQPELYFSSNSSEMYVKDLRTGADPELTKQTYNDIDVPVIVGTKLGPVRLGLGPVASINISSKSELADVTGYEEKFRTAAIGYQLGAGIDLLGLTLDARFEGSLSKFGDAINVASGQDLNFDARPNQFLISLGIKL